MSVVSPIGAVMGILDGKIAIVTGSAVIKGRGDEAVVNDDDVAAFGGAET